LSHFDENVIHYLLHSYKTTTNNTQSVLINESCRKTTAAILFCGKQLAGLFPLTSSRKSR